MNLSQKEWSDKFYQDQTAILLDVRTNDEFLDGSIPSAQNIDFYSGQDFINELELLDKSKHYYVYCKSGSRSEQTCAIMKQLGFDTAFNLEGGFTAWEGDRQ